MRKQPWIQKGANNAAAQKAIRDAILNRPEVQMALAKYVNSLNLQGQVNNRVITEQQAMELFTNAIQDFKRQLHTEINKCFTNNALDLTDLSNPLNIQAALNNLNNPNSLASIQMGDSTATINAEADRMTQDLVLSIQSETDFTQEAQQQTMTPEDSEQQNQQNQNQPENSPIPKPAYDLLKGAAIVEAIKALEDKPAAEATEKLVEKAFHGSTGMEGVFEKEGGKALEKTVAKEDSLLLAPVPRPSPPKD